MTLKRLRRNHTSLSSLRRTKSERSSLKSHRFLHRSQSEPNTQPPKPKPTESLRVQMRDAELAYVKISASASRHQQAWLQRINCALENASRTSHDHDAIQFLLTSYSLMEYLLCGDERQLLRTTSAVSLSVQGTQLDMLNEFALRVNQELLNLPTRHRKKRK